MTTPLALSLTTGGLVVRVGGNVLMPRGTTSVDNDALQGILTLVESASASGLATTIVPGGTGGQVFLEWARLAKCSDAFMNGIGCSLIDLSARILADHLARSLNKHRNVCSPRAAHGIEDLRLLHAGFPVVVSGSGVSGAITSDSLSLLIGEALGRPVLSIKRTLPFAELSSVSLEESGEHTCAVTVSDLEAAAAETDFIEYAGHHQALDDWSLRLLRRPSITLFITTIEAVLKFARVGRLDPVLKVCR